MNIPILSFRKPEFVLHNLMQEFNCGSLLELQEELKGAGLNNERELFYGAVFTTGISFVQNRPYFLKLAEKEPADIEMLDKNTYEQNQARKKKERAIDYWKIQNTHIPAYYIKEEMQKGEDNIYKIFGKFLEEKKLSSRAGDYKGCMLVFHIGVNTCGYFKLTTLKEHIRDIHQDNFRQIWVTCFSKPDYSEGQLTELLHGDLGLLQFPVREQKQQIK